jgi:hypothetical protein
LGTPHGCFQGLFKLAPLVTKGRFATLHGDSHSKLAQWDNVRTYRQGKRLGWQIPVQEILQHVMACENECPQLGMTLDKLFAIAPEYQKQAA